MIVDKQQNIKVHFATCEKINRAIITKAAKVNYGLGTAGS